MPRLVCGLKPELFKLYHYPVILFPVPGLIDPPDLDRTQDGVGDLLHGGIHPELLLLLGLGGLIGGLDQLDGLGLLLHDSSLKLYSRTFSGTTPDRARKDLCTFQRDRAAKVDSLPLPFAFSPKGPGR